MHLMSVPERVFAQLALFNPSVWDIHEQKILQVGPDVHPLFGHPLTVGMALPGVAGTLAVASRIGMAHAQISADLGEEIVRLPYNYVGDLLLYLQAPTGQPYAINWTIKSSGSDFHEKGRSEIKSLAHQKSDREKALLRHLLEREYYADAGIRTLALSLDDIPDMVVANLDLLYGYHDLPMGMDPSLLNDYSAELLEKSVQGIPPALVAIEYATRWGDRDLLLARIYQDIWCRKLLVNLNKPILVNKPLRIGGPDLLDVYAHLFEEHLA